MDDTPSGRDTSPTQNKRLSAQAGLVCPLSRNTERAAGWACSLPRRCSIQGRVQRAGGLWLETTSCGIARSNRVIRAFRIQTVAVLSCSECDQTQHFVIISACNVLLGLFVCSSGLSYYRHLGLAAGSSVSSIKNTITYIVTMW